MTDTPFGIFNSGVGGSTVAASPWPSAPGRVRRHAATAMIPDGAYVDAVATARVGETAKDVYRVLMEAGR